MGPERERSTRHLGSAGARFCGGAGHQIRDDDRNVPFAQSVQLAEALRKQGVHFEQLVFPDEIHDFLMYGHWLAAYTATDEFLGRYLAP